MKAKRYTHGVTFFMAPEMFQELKQLSDTRQLSLLELLRNIIEQHLKANLAQQS